MEQKFLYYIAGLIFLFGGLLYASIFFDMEKERAGYLMDDQNRKSSIELNISASGGNRNLTKAEIVTSILADTQNTAYAVNSEIVLAENIQLAKRNLYDISNDIPEGLYVASHVYDATGQIIGIQYLTAQEENE